MFDKTLSIRDPHHIRCAKKCHNKQCIRYAKVGCLQMSIDWTADRSEWWCPREKWEQQQWPKRCADRARILQIIAELLKLIQSPGQWLPSVEDPATGKHIFNSESRTISINDRYLRKANSSAHRISSFAPLTDSVDGNIALMVEQSVSFSVCLTNKNKIWRMSFQSPGFPYNFINSCGTWNLFIYILSCQSAVWLSIRS